MHEDRRPEVHLRMLTSEDAPWVVEVDQRSRSPVVEGFDWEVEKLAAELDEGIWASGDRWGWAIVVDGEPAGFALVTDLAEGDAQIEIRITPEERGQGVGREVLRQLADHHFAAREGLTRLAGRAHEQNVPMQRAFNAAGFRMEARYRESLPQPDGGYASEWGYALTRGDWEAGRHQADDDGYDLHGLSFVVEEILEGPGDVLSEVLFKFLQEGRRVMARYSGGQLTAGELAGILAGDLLVYRFIQDVDDEQGHRVATGGGRARLQRRQDGRLEMVNEWSDDRGRTGKTFLVERR